MFRCVVGVSDGPRRLVGKQDPSTTRETDVSGRDDWSSGVKGQGVFRRRRNPRVEDPGEI